MTSPAAREMQRVGAQWAASTIEPCAANEPGRPAGGRHSSYHRRGEGLIDNAAINKSNGRVACRSEKSPVFAR